MLNDKKFNGDGLRYSIGHLDTIFKKIKRGQIRDIKELSRYCDAICYHKIKEGDPGLVITKQVNESIENLKKGRADFSSLNTTSFGNASYIAVNHPDLSVRKNAILVINHLFAELDCQRFLNLRV